MGRKVHPLGFRLKINKTWEGRWYAEGKDYVDRLHQDFAVRKLIDKSAPRAGVSRIEIERFPGNVRIQVHTAKPGILIGRKGENVKILRKDLEELVGIKIDLDIKEIKEPDLELQYTAGTPQALLRFFWEGSGDAVLIINAPDGKWYCNDDTAGFNPQITFTNPPIGSYDVYVAKRTTNSAGDGTLSITEFAGVVVTE